MQAEGLTVCAKMRRLRLSTRGMKMTRHEALETAKVNFKAHRAADLAEMFHNGPAFNAEEAFGYRHGWYRVGEFSFCLEDITGEKYDITQGGWAFI
jgi:hypothetical protein